MPTFLRKYTDPAISVNYLRFEGKRGEDSIVRSQHCLADRVMPHTSSKKRRIPLSGLCLLEYIP
jgi:hypothetical protein